MEEYSELTKRKIQLYFGANYLYAQGKSHPQVVEILAKFEHDHELLVSVADAAMQDKWRIVFNEVQKLISVGKNYEEVFKEVTPLESDPEILHFIYNHWYKIQSIYAENIIESSTNIWDGIQWTVICIIGLIAMIYFDRSVLSKIIWGLGLVASIITWIYGLHQKKLAKEIQHILEKDYTKFSNLI
jgi:hypothetical protein